jgi:hypothetical protein
MRKAVPVFLAALFLSGCFNLLGPGEIDNLDLVIEKYQVKVPYVSHGTIVPNITSAVVAEKITLMVSPDTDYRLKAGSLQVNGNAAVISGAGGYYNFPMPLGNAVVRAVFESVDPGEPRYTIRVKPNEGGAVEPSLWQAAEGAVISLRVDVRDGYRLKTDALRVTGEDGAGIPLHGNSFTMPAQNVTVEAAFEPIPPDAIRYKISAYSEDDSKGTVLCDLAEAAEGMPVQVTVKPAAFCRLQSIRVTGNVADLTIYDPETYTFTMPAADVEIWAEFDSIPALYTISGKISTSDGNSAEGAKLELIDAEFHTQSEDQAGPGGLYLISNISPGSYTLRVRLYGYNDGEIPDLMVSGDTSDKNLTLQKAERTYTVSGRVSTSDGGSPVSAKVWINKNGSLVSGKVSPDASGNYRIDNIAPGEGYTVEASLLPGYESAKTKEFNVSDADVSGKDLILQKLYTISGKVSASGGGSLENAHVQLKKNGGYLNGPVNADNNGDYTIQDVLPGSYTVEASYPGYVSDSKDGIIIKAADKSGIDFFLQKAIETYTISGTISITGDVSTSPVQGADVWLRRNNVLFGGPVFTDEHGNYTIPGIEAFEVVEVAANYKNYHEAYSGEFQVNGNTVKDLTLNREVAFTRLSGNGGLGTTTTVLELTFTEDIKNLSAANIKLSPESIVVAKGALTSTGTPGVYTLGLTISGAGEITVEITSPEGYFITGQQTVDVYFAAVTSISVSPPMAVVLVGNSNQFNASVTVTGDASSDVTWSLNGQVIDSTINSTGDTKVGLLAVGLNETAQTITVTATSVFDPTKSASAAVTVCAPSNFQGIWEYEDNGGMLYDVISVRESYIQYYISGSGWKVEPITSTVTANSTIPGYPAGFKFTGTVAKVTEHISPSPSLHSQYTFELYLSTNRQKLIWKINENEFVYIKNESATEPQLD